MQPIGLATLFTTPTEITGHNGSISPGLWVGNAIDESQSEIRLYVKLANQHELLSECICSLLCNHLGLPVPKTYLVNDPQSLLKGGIMIGSQDEQIPSLKQIFLKDPAAVEYIIQKWNRAHEVAVFDEWIANNDRNLGNLLWDGDKNWYLIDHARSLWSHLTTCHPDMPTKNIFADVISNLQQDIGCQRMKNAAAPFSLKCRTISKEAIKNASQSKLLGMSSRADEALTSLIERIEHLPILLSRHGSQPDLLS